MKDHWPWISVYERLPKQGKVVIVTEDGEAHVIESDWLNENYFSDPEKQPEFCRKAKYWISLPE